MTYAKEDATLLSGTTFFARLSNGHRLDREALFSEFPRWSVVHLRTLSSVTTEGSLADLVMFAHIECS